jgi:hypothetical protein
MLYPFDSPHHNKFTEIDTIAHAIGILDFTLHNLHLYGPTQTNKFMRYKRYKLVISRPAILATAMCILGFVTITYSHLTVTNRKFVISMGVPTLFTYVIAIVLLTLFTFVFFEGKK